jgi:hypothetical protein
MGSPDGHGSSTGEGREGALLLLRGGRAPEADGMSERSSTLPSSNALRPDSGLNLGWYRPDAPDRRPPDTNDLDERPGHDEPRGAGEPESTLMAVPTRLDLRTGAARSDPTASPLGARRPRSTPARGSQASRRRGAGPARVGVGELRRLAAVRLGPGAREVFTRPVVAGIAAVLLAVIAVAVIALEHPTRPHRDPAQTASALKTRLPGAWFLSDVTSGLDALGRSGFTAAARTRLQASSRSDTHQSSRTVRATSRQSGHRHPARMSATSRPPTRVSQGGSTSQTVSEGPTNSGTASGSTADAGASEQTTPVQHTPAQQTPETSTQQPVHYQPPSESAGPAGLGSQVGGNCNPKCS